MKALKSVIRDVDAWGAEAPYPYKMIEATVEVKSHE